RSSPLPFSRPAVLKRFAADRQERRVALEERAAAVEQIRTAMNGHLYRCAACGVCAADGHRGLYFDAREGCQGGEGVSGLFSVAAIRGGVRERWASARAVAPETLFERAWRSLATPHIAIVNECVLKLLRRRNVPTRTDRQCLRVRKCYPCLRNSLSPCVRNGPWDLGVGSLAMSFLSVR